MNAQATVRMKPRHSVKTGLGRGVKMFLSFALFLVFMIPFLLVIVNSAKTAAEISLNPTTLPTNWGQLWKNVVGVVNNPNFSYLEAFTDSVIITVISLLLALLATLYPSWRASRTQPAEALRYE